jgi:hypothetical protein
MTHRQQQLTAMLGAVPAFVIVFLCWRYAHDLLLDIKLPNDDAASRLAFVVRWLLFPGLTLVAGIQFAARRGFIPDAIDGTRTPANHALEINLRYNLNTVEQLVVAVLAWLGLAVMLPVDQLIAIPASTMLFTFGRLTFWIGYLIHPLARAFGMTLTALPTLCAYAWLLWHWSVA